VGETVSFNRIDNFSVESSGNKATIVDGCSFAILVLEEVVTVPKKNPDLKKSRGLFGFWIVQESPGDRLRHYC
jgi:hypothetical protein